MSNQNHNEKRKDDRSFRNGHPHYSSANDQAEFERHRKEAARMAARLNRDLMRADPTTQQENLVDGVHMANRRRYFLMYQGLYKDQDENWALAIGIYPRFQAPLGSSSGKPFIGRKIMHIPAEKAGEWLRKYGISYRQMAESGELDKPHNTESLRNSPRSELADEQFIIGRGFALIDTIYSHECLYQDKKSKRFSLEITLFDKGPDTLGLQENEPYILRATMPLSETDADLWVRSYGAPDVAPEMYVRLFRALFTNLNPCDGFIWEDWSNSR